MKLIALGCLLHIAAPCAAVVAGTFLARVAWDCHAGRPLTRGQRWAVFPVTLALAVLGGVRLALLMAGQRLRNLQRR